MRVDDRIWAVALIALAAAIMLVASGFPRPAGMAVGPGLFPIVLSAALIGASVLLALNARLQARTGDTQPGLIVLPPELRERRPWWRVFAVLGSCLLFALLGQTLGFLIVGILSLGWLLVAFGTRPGPAALIAIVAVVVIDLFLVRVMRIPLPLGVMSTFGGWL